MPNTDCSQCKGTGYLEGKDGGCVSHENHNIRLDARCYKCNPGVNKSEWIQDLNKKHISDMQTIILK